MFTALGPASEHCINLQLQKPSSHIKLKDLFWGIERFIAEKKKKLKFAESASGGLSCEPPLTLSQHCSLYSCLQGDTSKPGKNSEMSGVLQPIPTPGLRWLLMSLRVVLESYPNDAETQTHIKQSNPLLLLWCPVQLDLQKVLFIFQGIFQRTVVSFQCSYSCIFIALVMTSGKWA